MVVLAISQGVLLLAFCLDLTLATSESFADVDQDRGDEIDSNINLNEDVDSLDSLMGEENYVYIDDDGQGARFQYEGHGTEADHLSSRVENKNIIEECKLDEAGAHGLAGLPCDIEIKGADENRDGNIPWGIDGSYKLIGCYARYPVYKREGKTRLRASLQLFHPHPGNNERRFLWFSTVFHDWDVGMGDFLKDQMNRPPLMYGASTPMMKRPELLGADAWLVMHAYHPAHADVTYSPMKVSVTCAPNTSPAAGGSPGATGAGAQAATPALKAQRDAASVLKSVDSKPAM